MLLLSLYQLHTVCSLLQCFVIQPVPGEVHTYAVTRPPAPAASDGDAILQAAQKLFWWAAGKAGNARQALAARHTWPVAVILRQITPKYLAILARERPAIGCGALADPALAKRQRHRQQAWGVGVLIRGATC